ncbi:MAG: TatD family hydrolase [Deltaproteobacteria bacterium]|nr:TatD family hydrolase [Deltaproteobacteria bacterium]
MTALEPMIDTHCHLDFEDFAPEREQILERGRAEGIRWFVTIGSGRDEASSHAAVALAHEHRDVIATVGVHPHDARCLDDATFERVAALARDERVVGVGEVGLDYHYDHSPREEQQRAFRLFVRLAREVKKPIVIHTRAAPEDTLTILREEGAREVGGVIHCFTEDASFARSALDLGFDISFSGIVTFKNSEALRDVARVIPTDRLLIETDAPYLAPIPHRGRRNEPSYLAKTAAHLASTLGMDERALRRATTLNAMARFGLSRFEEARQEG